MKKFLGEFKEFISKGNVIDLAVAVVIGGAFGKIVTSLVENIITPLIGMITGGVDITGLKATVGKAELTYGIFLQNVLDFIIIAFAIFLFVKAINKMMSLKKKKEEKEEAPAKSSEVLLLEEIRDLLKKNK